jgi:hypothetical protein
MGFGEFEITDAFTTKNTLSINLRSGKISGVLSGVVFIDKDTKQYISYIPAFDISGYGETKEKAREILKFSLDQLFSHLTDLSQEELQIEMKKLGWNKSRFFNKQFSTAYVDVNGVLQNFNVEANSIQGITLTAA